MKAITLQQYGSPDVFQLEHLPTPQPGAGEVQVRVQAVSINPIDYKWRQHGPFQNFPVILGWDISGVIEALGPEVTEFAVGDEVFGMVRFPEEGRAYAEQVIAPVTDIALKPANLSHAEAAAMSLAALTAEQAFDRIGLTAGQTILIHAAAGGVGHFAVQLAKARGANVIATASERNRDFVMKLGADQFINYREQPFEEQVSNVDAVFDTVGGDTQTRSYSVIKKGGWLVTIVGKASEELAKQRNVQATQILVHPSHDQLNLFSKLFQAGKLKPHISQTFPFKNIADAHRAQETGHTVGKIVLEIV